MQGYQKKKYSQNHDTEQVKSIHSFQSSHTGTILSNQITGISPQVSICGVRNILPHF